jgi:hypothetical protein
MRPIFLTLAALSLALPATAQTPPQNVRGPVKSLSGADLTIQTAVGPTIVKLSATWSVVEMQPVGVEAIKPGSFIGTTTVEKADGTGRSLEVHVFPPGVKIGEGSYPWDLKPHSTMTNGTVGKVVEGAKGRTLEVAYTGGSRSVLVPPNIPIVQITPGTRAMVKPGVKVFIVPIKRPDGALAADTVAVGQNGAAPPM